MAWERKGRRKYYYRAFKKNGKVVRQYLGSGPQAERAAAQDAERRRQREAEDEARRLESKRWERVETLIRELIRVTDFLVRASLIGAGYHQHDRGAWRRMTHGRRIQN